MRGTQVGEVAHGIHGGIIPAHAGNTWLNVALAAGSRDHPRACGEHLASSYRTASEWGSSPRMRGTPSFPAMGHGTSWIIPAHAGNTEIDDLVKSLFGDHPRACGEHWPTISAWPSTRGSSPRMRGTLQRKHALADMAGIIPAHAGNTYGEPHHDLAGGDHPRACGEHCMSRNHPRT